MDAMQGKCKLRLERVWVSSATRGGVVGALGMLGTGVPATLLQKNLILLFKIIKNFLYKKFFKDFIYF